MLLRAHSLFRISTSPYSPHAAAAAAVMPLITRFNHQSTGPTSPSYPPSTTSTRNKLAGLLYRRGSASTGPPSSPSNISNLSRGASNGSATSLNSAAAAADSSLFITDYRNEKEGDGSAPAASPTSPTRPGMTGRRPSRLWSALTPKPAPEPSFIVHHSKRSASVTSAANPATASSLQLVASPAVSPEERPTSSSGSMMGGGASGGFALHSFRKASESGITPAAAAAVAAVRDEKAMMDEDDWRPPGAGEVGGWAHQESAVQDEPESFEASAEVTPQRTASPSPQRQSYLQPVQIAAPISPTTPSPTLLEPPSYPMRAISPTPSPSGTMAAGRFRRNVRSRSDLFADDDDVPLAALSHSGATTPNLMSSPVLGARRLSARSPAEELAALEAELAKGRMTPRTFVRAKDAVEEAGGGAPPVPQKEMRSREGSFGGAGSRPRVRQLSSACSLSSLRGGLDGAAPSAGGSGGMDSASILASRGWTGEEGGQPATLLDALARLERRGASSSAVAEDEIAPPRRPWVDTAAAGGGARERTASSGSTGTPARPTSPPVDGGALGLSSAAAQGTVTTSSSTDTVQLLHPKVGTAAKATTLSKKPVITFVTGNAHKLREVRQILAASPDFAFELVNQDLDTPEVQGTTQEVARAKCKAAAQIIRGPVITEDTALGFTALKELPGPYIKDFMKAVGHDGLNRMLDGFSDRSATALCTFAFCAGPEDEVLLFEGKTRGSIVQARGPTHFGWDAIMEIDGAGLTYAEMESEQKNKLSHRYKALAMLQTYLTSLSASLTNASS